MNQGHELCHEGMWGVTLLSESESSTILSTILSSVPRKTALCNKLPNTNKCLYQ